LASGGSLGPFLGATFLISSHERIWAEFWAKVADLSDEEWSSIEDSVWQTALTEPFNQFHLPFEVLVEDFSSLLDRFCVRAAV